MANLKLDLLNKINNEKYFQEMELIRLAQEPNMNYKEKIAQMSELLQNIAIFNAQVGLIGHYFPEVPQQVAPANPATTGAPVGQPHPGQTFSE